MFTGIIQEVGKIEKYEVHKDKRYITIACNTIQKDLEIGESVACNGICLTVIKFSQANITVEIMNQTRETTTASSWSLFSSVHLERAMTLNDRLNGHLVQGHIDTTCSLLKSYHIESTLYLEFNLPKEYANLIVEHGSICIDGVSLTVAILSKTSFTVALIEHTLVTTHLGKLGLGDKVNIEFDIIGKYVQRLVLNPSKDSNITEDWLVKKGF
jgi:riboflavin synthase